MKITPASVNIELSEGKSTTIRKIVTTPVVPPKPDIVFVVDTTTSMKNAIASIQRDIMRIINRVRASQPTAAFAVTEYQDFAVSPYPFKVLQNLTRNDTAIVSAISRLSEDVAWAYTGNFDEDSINALYQVSRGAIAFRKDSTPVIVWVGDAASHNPSNGHTLEDAITALEAAHVRVIAVDVDTGLPSDLDEKGQASAVVKATNGRLFMRVDADRISEVILRGLTNLTVSVRPVIQSVSPGLQLSFDPNYQRVVSGTNAIFMETVAVSSDATPGSTLSAKVEFLVEDRHVAGAIQSLTNVVPKHATKLIVNDSTSDFHDQGTLSATLIDAVTSKPIMGATLEFAMGAEACQGTTDANGRASCTIIPTEPAGTYPIAVDFDGDAQHLSATSTGSYVVTLEQTTIEYTGPSVIENGRSVTLSAVLKEDGVTPIQGREVTLTLGSGETAQSCTGTTNAEGVATCTLTVDQPLGQGVVSAVFEADAYYEPARDEGVTTMIFEFPSVGTFVIGDEVPGIEVGASVTFWGSRWGDDNKLSRSPKPPRSFKGYENSVDRPSCGASWQTDTGRSSEPPATVPSFMGMIVASLVEQDKNVITGDTVHVVVVQTNPGYENSVGKDGTGTIVALVC